jgi:hypothetical protein
MIGAHIAAETTAVVLEVQELCDGEQFVSRLNERACNDRGAHRCRNHCSGS